MQNNHSNVTADSVTATFDDTAARYEEELNRGVSLTGESREFFAEQRVQWVVERLRASGCAPTKVLDFGCGTGGATPYFFSQLSGLKQLVGVDPSEMSLTVARQQAAALGRPASYFSTVDEALASAGPVDLAFCNGVFHHIIPEDRQAALESVWKMLVPGGWFAFSENNPWNPMMRYAMSRVSFDKDAILISPPAAKKLLAGAGFHVRKLDFLFFFPKALGALRPLERHLTKAPMGAQYIVFAQRGD